MFATELSRPTATAVVALCLTLATGVAQATVITVAGPGPGPAPVVTTLSGSAGAGGVLTPQPRVLADLHQHNALPSQRRLVLTQRSRVTVSGVVLLAVAGTAPGRAACSAAVTPGEATHLEAIGEPQPVLLPAGVPAAPAPVLATVDLGPGSYDVGVVCHATAGAVSPRQATFSVATVAATSAH